MIPTEILQKYIQNVFFSVEGKDYDKDFLGKIDILLIQVDQSPEDLHKKVKTYIERVGCIDWNSTNPFSTITFKKVPPSLEQACFLYSEHGDQLKGKVAVVGRTDGEEFKTPDGQNATQVVFTNVTQAEGFLNKIPDRQSVHRGDFYIDYPCDMKDDENENK